MVWSEIRHGMYILCRARLPVTWVTPLGSLYSAHITSNARTCYIGTQAARVLSCFGVSAVGSNLPQACTEGFFCITNEDLMAATW